MARRRSKSSWRSSSRRAAHNEPSAVEAAGAEGSVSQFHAAIGTLMVAMSAAPIRVVWEIESKRSSMFDSSDLGMFPRAAEQRGAFPPP